MSNLTDKNASRRAPLFHLNNPTSHTTDSDQTSLENSLKSQAVNLSKKNKVDSQGRVLSDISSFDQNSNENEIIKNLKRALKEAMDENTAVSSFFVIKTNINTIV